MVVITSNLLVAFIQIKQILKKVDNNKNILSLLFYKLIIFLLEDFSHKDKEQVYAF